MSKLIAVALVSIMVLFIAPSTVTAYPKFTQMRYYFSDSTGTTEVGARVVALGYYNCDEPVWGVTSAYYETFSCI